jgi:putative nucleotidyltransferase with HDIG domain
MDGARELGELHDMGDGGDVFARPPEGVLGFRGVFESVPVPTAYFHGDGRLCALNQCFRDTLGYDDADLPTFDAWLRRACPDAKSRNELSDQFHPPANGLAEPTYHRFPKVERWLRRKDGTDILGVVSLVQLDQAIIVSFFDLTDQRRSEDQIRASEEGFRQVAARLEVQNWALTAYANAADALHTATSDEDLARAVCESITRQKRYSLCWIGLADDGPGKPVRLLASSGSAQGYLVGIELSWDGDQPSGRGPGGRCIRLRQTERTADIDQAEEFAPWRERAMAAGIRSNVSVPIRSRETVLGALMVYAPTPDAFGDDECSLFERLASEVAQGLLSFARHRELAERTAHREQVQAKLSQALEATITAMSSTMEQRDPYTAGHERRVAEIAAAIAGELGWAAERQHALRMAGLVHDIGKIAVPAEILTKPTRLTSPEFELIKQHAETGYQILKDVPFPWEVARMVHEHHERIDGKGYPMGLTGDQVLPESRILAIADMLEAMASHRPYRPSRGLDVALAQIESESGKTLDPEGVAACLRLYRDRRVPLPD